MHQQASIQAAFTGRIQSSPGFSCFELEGCKGRCHPSYSISASYRYDPRTTTTSNIGAQDTEGKRRSSRSLDTHYTSRCDLGRLATPPASVPQHS
ncbi:hypothetical protein LINGRAHAP2_LOCUS36726 [Linum grandiflorum]